MRIRDARGRLAALLEDSQLPTGAPPDLIAAVKGAQEHSLRSVAKGFVLFIAVLGIISMVLAAAGSRLRPDVGFFVLWGGVYAVVAVLAMLIGGRAAGRHARTAVDLCIARRICAGCGYGLEHLQPEGDGCVVCPECGAAWRLASPAASLQAEGLPRS